MPLGRRPILAAIGGALSNMAWAASPSESKVFRIGVLSFQYPKDRNLVLPALARIGYEEGRNVVYEYRFGGFDPAKTEAMAAELVALKVDLIIASAGLEAQALMRLTSTIPIVMTYTLAPVELGMIRSYAQPGGNLTGTAWWEPSIAGKVVSLIREIAPRARRFANLEITGVPGAQYYIEARRAAANAVGMEMVLINIHNESELKSAFERIRREKIEAIFSSDMGILETLRPAIIEFAQIHKIPTYTPRRNAVMAGFVMGYFPDITELPARTATIIDRVLKGENPATIPVERPMRISTMVNLKAAQAIGLKVPESILQQATEIIQ
jgi:putative tryptophan/tyrosine transport system substrate-binding protein